MKKYICTLSDKHYFTRGMALIESLKKYNENITVYYLCMDEESYNKSKTIEDKNIIFIFYKDIIKGDDQFKDIKPGREATAVGEHTEISCELMEMNYKMSSFFPKYCLKTYEIDHIIYIDSDIFFYDSLDSIYEDVGDKSIGFVEHRLPYTGCGIYNVGVLYFKNDEVSNSMLNFWSYCVLDPTNQYAEEFGTCGDQKYLELMYKLYQNNIAIIGNRTGHLAPWNLAFHEYTYDEHIVWRKNKQKVVYIHFSNFTPDFHNMSYKVGPRHGINSVDSVPWLARKCEEYLYALKENI